MALPAAARSILALVSTRSLALSLSIRVISTSGRSDCRMADPPYLACAQRFSP
ncbi:hypothetical protein CBK03_003013 [Salmonella enterica subsp. enterica serovar Elisabethville]|nr:hypothetical protein [Salmonella enterica subsp. enterica serovar Gafsa]EDT7915379.1 hypothetical protein [Salmonella enterica subsp. enterica serovar Elisabethville]EDV7888369.1 hypothetical protein [Salmonella enterica subsp. enterica serovar Yoruba]EED8014745.1 hypothetical protein [Salmonella enterica subsp. enterica]EDU0316668.1 hypothetical protein [Salmonella enterica subsp. enterica serovar Elisabethville]